MRTAIARELDAAACATSRRHAATGRHSSSRPTGRTTPSRWRVSSSKPAPGTRVGVGRPASGTGLGRSLLEARAALDAVDRLRRVVPRPRLARAAAEPPERGARGVRRPRARPAAGNAWLLESLTALLDSGCRWSEAADRLGRPPAHAPVPHGAAAQADRTPSGRSGAADGALARGEGKAGARRQGGRPSGRAPV